MERVAACVAAGLPRDSLILDPGFGFGKTLEHNLALLRRLDELVATGFPVLAGLSRKSHDRPAGRRAGGRARPTGMGGSLALALVARARGARIVRVHDVAADRAGISGNGRPREQIMSRKLFGTDGIRGRVGEYPMTAEFALRLASAAAHVLAPEGGTVLIGKDTRVSGYMFESALEAGFVAAGMDVLLVGPLPTPGIAYLTRTLGADAGVVISASHNPYDDNGIKFFDAQWQQAVRRDRGGDRGAAVRAGGHARVRSPSAGPSGWKTPSMPTRPSASRRCRPTCASMASRS